MTATLDRATRRPGGSGMLRDLVDARAAGLALGDDPIWVDHGERVGDVAAVIAARMGFDEEAIDRLRIASSLHDIGKFAFAETVVRKPRPLDGAEWAQMRLHPIHGYWMLRSRVDREVAMTVLTHHERFDGKGYPFGLEGAQIPMPARIISVVDAYDAIVCERPYSPAQASERAIEEIAGGAGSQFDPLVAEVFLASIDQ
jgi:HD-GYP domain-containing protein (c-di-GMP phosphodiesterase class II)